MTACVYIYLIALAISWALGLLAYETLCNNLLECLPNNSFPVRKTQPPNKTLLNQVYYIW